METNLQTAITEEYLEYNRLKSKCENHEMHLRFLVLHKRSTLNFNVKEPLKTFLSFLLVTSN